LLHFLGIYRLFLYYVFVLLSYDVTWSYVCSVFSAFR
jgi:hypothetical protein